MVAFALVCVVAKGSGRSAYVDGYRVGGKTGTAQKASENGGYLPNNYILSFLGAAPMNDPEVMVYLAIDNPKNTIQYGGVVAAPMVGEIFEQILPIVGIKRQYDTQIEKEYRYYIDQKYVRVDNYVGLEKNKVKTNPSYKIIYEGTGNKVIYQYPESNERIVEGGSVILYLG